MQAPVSPPAASASAGRRHLSPQAPAPVRSLHSGDLDTLGFRSHRWWRSKRMSTNPLILLLSARGEPHSLPLERELEWRLTPGGEVKGSGGL